MSTSTFGGDLRLISQVVMLGSKLGNPEQMLKSFAGNHEALAYVLDYIAFHFTAGYPVRDKEGCTVEMRFVCFSESSRISNDEANARVKRFGRYATKDELNQFFVRFKDDDKRFEFNYPIVTHSIPSFHRSDDYKYTEISWRSVFGTMGFYESGSGGICYEQTGMMWGPATVFAVIPREQPNWDVLSHRKQLKKSETAE